MISIPLNMQSVTCIVVAHGRAQSSFNLTLPFFLRHECPMIVVCPCDDVIEFSGTRVLCGSGGTYCTLEYGEMWSKVLELASLADTEHVAIFEYDSVCLSKILPIRGRGLFGLLNVIGHDMEAEYQFLVERYANFPIMGDVRSFRKMSSVLWEYQLLLEYEGFPDRLFAALASLAGVPLFSYRPRGYGAPGSNITSERLADLIKVLDRGGRVVHGVKTAEVCDILLKYMD